MKLLDEFRSSEKVTFLVNKIKSILHSKITIMEVCGGQAHNIIKFGIDEMLKDSINIIHGPGCPVCVTPAQAIDKAVEIALNPNVILLSYGDMLRVKGSNLSLLEARALGADIRIVYSALNAINVSLENPTKTVVFFAIGFETTAAVNALCIYKARQLNIKNLFFIVSQVKVPPVLSFILSDSDFNFKLDAILAAGHVCTVMGTEEYIELTERYSIPIVVAGFEPVDILYATLVAVECINNKKNMVVNAYNRVVREVGNTESKKIMRTVFKDGDFYVRGIGSVKNAAFVLSDEYRDLDAQNLFGAIHYDDKHIIGYESAICDQVLKGIKIPSQCQYFAKECAPDHPIGAPMVSAEGVCNAFYKFKRGYKI